MAAADSIAWFNIILKWLIVIPSVSVFCAQPGSSWSYCRICTPLAHEDLNVSQHGGLTQRYNDNRRLEEAVKMISCSVCDLCRDMHKYRGFGGDRDSINHTQTAALQRSLGKINKGGGENTPADDNLGFWDCQGVNPAGWSWRHSQSQLSHFLFSHLKGSGELKGLFVLSLYFKKKMFIRASITWKICF